MLSFFKALDSKITNNLQICKSKDMDLVENHYKNFRFRFAQYDVFIESRFCIVESIL